MHCFAYVLALQPADLRALDRPIVLGITQGSKSAYICTYMTAGLYLFHNQQVLAPQFGQGEVYCPQIQPEQPVGVLTNPLRSTAHPDPHVMQSLQRIAGMKLVGILHGDILVMVRRWLHVQ